MAGPARPGGPDDGGDPAAAVAAERDAERQAAEDARRSQERRRLRRWAGLAVVVALAVGVVTSMILVPGPDRPAAELQRGTGPFSADGLAVPGAVAAAFSPNGRQLAVLKGDGALGLAEQGRFRPLVREGTVVAGFAWYGDGRLLVREGPTSTGILATLRLDGSEDGVLRLEPDVPVGDGLAVSPDRRTVVLVGEDRAGPLDPRTEADLWAVSVPDGAARAVAATPGAHEHRPRFVDPGRVAVTARRASGSRVEVVDLATGAAAALSDEGSRADVLAAGDGQVVWSDGRRVLVRPADGSAPAGTLGSVPEGSVAVAVDPGRRVLVVRETDPTGTDTVLRAVPLVR